MPSTFPTDEILLGILVALAGIAFGGPAELFAVVGLLLGAGAYLAATFGLGAVADEPRGDDA